MTEARGVVIAIAVALIGAAGAIIAVLITGSANDSTSPFVPPQVANGGTTEASPWPIPPPISQIVPTTSPQARQPSPPPAVVVP